MCATVCPSQALYFGPAEEVMRMRQERPVQEFHFGEQALRTKVKVMSAPGTDRLDYDILEFMPGANGSATDIAGLSVYENWLGGMEVLDVTTA
jgi:hypothetical protein